MSTKIGLISDVHSKPAPVEEALSIFERNHVDRVICAGDIAGYYDELDATIDLLTENHCHTIIGNHDQSYIESHSDDTNTKAYHFLNNLPKTIEDEIEGKRLYVVHAQPPALQHGGIKLLDIDGGLIPEQLEFWKRELNDFDYDILIVGHTHQVYAEQIGEVLVINPGSTQFNHNCMILTLPDMKVQAFALENKKTLKAWNWSMFVRQQ
jgi:putative phosphoesterase